MNHPLGQVFSLLAALTWAYALVLFKQSTVHISPIGLNLFKNAIGLVLLFATLAVMAAAGQEQFDTLLHHSARDLGILMLSGIIGIALADTVFFYALNLIGVGLISIVDCAYAPSAIFFSWLMLGEKLAAWHYVGGAMVVAGVFIATRHERPANRTRGQIIAGMLLAMLAVCLMALGIVIAKPILDDFPVVWATTLRMMAGAAVLALFALVGPGRRDCWTVFRPSKSWKRAVPASVLGSYVCMLFWVAGMKFTYASIAAVLNQTSVVFASILAAVLLKEQFGPRNVLAIVLAMAGVALVTFGEHMSDAWLAITAGAVVLGLVGLGVKRILHPHRPEAISQPRAGYCVACNFDQRGLPGTKCPECGTPFPPAAAANQPIVCVPDPQAPPADG
jgi:drug/metabolite transporter (DMT)-like permease